SFVSASWKLTSWSSLVSAASTNGANAKMMMRKDLNKDGKLSAEELGKRMAPFVEAADTNDDQLVSFQEAETKLKAEEEAEKAAKEKIAAEKEAAEKDAAISEKADSSADASETMTAEEAQLEADKLQRAADAAQRAADAAQRTADALRRDSK
ncbi:MAG: hypothetical protein AAFP69_21195, partial [Planctomycetota bacterium]